MIRFTLILVGAFWLTATIALTAIQLAAWALVALVVAMLFMAAMCVGIVRFLRMTPEERLAAAAQGREHFAHSRWVAEQSRHRRAHQTASHTRSARHGSGHGHHSPFRMSLRFLSGHHPHL